MKHLFDAAVGVCGFQIVLLALACFGLIMLFGMAKVQARRGIREAEKVAHKAAREYNGASPMGKLLVIVLIVAVSVAMMWLAK